MIYFAVVSGAEEFDPLIHSREDLTVFRLLVSQSEGEFARADMSALNTRAPVPGQRIFISEDNVLIFAGEITSAPRGAIGQKINIEAVARPTDAEARLAALAESLKTAPQWDPLFSDPGNRNDISEILTGHGKVLAWDRRTGDVEAVDPLEGGTNILLTPLNNTLNVDVDGTVPSAVRFELSAEWKQLAVQGFDLNGPLQGLTSMTPEGLISGWPAPGRLVGDGFRVVQASCEEDLDAFGRQQRELVEVMRNVSADELDPAFIAAGQVPDRAEIAPIDASLVLEQRYEVKRREVASVSLSASVQGILRSGEEEVEQINLQDLAGETDAAPWRPEAQYSAGDLVLDGGEVFEARNDHLSGVKRDPAKWILVGESSYLSSRRVSSFFATDRGQRALAHAVERAKARLRYAARSVVLSFDCAMPFHASVSSVTNAFVDSPLLASNFASGRVVFYELRWGGGRRDASFEVACAAGNGAGTVAPEMTMTGGSPAFVSGRAELEVRNPGADQKERFLQSGDISPTEVRVRTTPAPSRQFEHTVSFTSQDVLQAPQQIDFT